MAVYEGARPRTIGLPRAPRIEERKRIGLRGRSPIASVELEGIRMLPAIVPFADLVLAAPVGLAATGW